MAALVTVEEFQAETGGQFSDTRVPRWLLAAQAAVESEIGPVAPTTLITTLAAGRGGVVLLTPPVLSITSVVSGGVTADHSSYPLNLRSGLLTLPYAYADTVVTYQAGRTPDADPLFEATVWEVHLSVALRLSDQDRGAAVVGYGSGTDEQFVPGGFPPLSPRDLALLAPYRLRGPAIA